MTSDVDEWRAATVMAVMRQRPPWHAVLTDARQTNRERDIRLADALHITTSRRILAGWMNRTGDDAVWA